MSIFKTREWWSTSSEADTQLLSGLQNESCLKVDKVGTNYESDLILTGNASGMFKIYKPQRDFKPTDLILEHNFNEPIIQIDTGNFFASSSYIQIIILHENKFSVYNLVSKEGHTDVGDQNAINSVLEHKFKSMSAFSMRIGKFGNVKNRDLICVQMHNGIFNIYDQDVFLFTFNVPEVLLPAPFAYIPSSDCFVICNTCWIMEIYSYQQLSEISNITKQSNKKLVPQWVYNTSEEIYSLQVIQTSNNISTIVVLGERHLYALQDNGLLKFIKKLDFTPLCFWAYLIGWYYEPGSRLLTMVASDESKLMIYESTTLLWSCELPYPPISICKAVLVGLPSGVVTLSAEGVVTCSYLGTEPELNSAPLMHANDSVDHVKVQRDLEEAEVMLRKINDGEDSDTEETVNELLKVSIEIDSPSKDQSCDGENLAICSVKINIKPEKTIKAIQITYKATPPVTFRENTSICDDITGDMSLKNYISLASTVEISSLNVKFLFVITHEDERIRIVTKTVDVPLRYVYKLREVVKEGSQKIVFVCQNSSPVSLTKLFSDFDKTEMISLEATEEILTFVRNDESSAKGHVSIVLSKNLYCVYSDSYSNMAVVVECLVNRLKSFDVSVQFVGSFSVDLVQAFYELIERHTEERLHLQELEKDLVTLQKQFTLIQKRHLVQFGSVPPGNCDRLQFLMKDTYAKIVHCAESILTVRDGVFRIGCKMAAMSALLIKILKVLKVKSEYVALVENVISYDFINEDYLEWQEVASPSVTFVLRSLFTKTDKNKEKLVAIPDQGILHQNNLKRFFKMLRLLFERIMKVTTDILNEEDVDQTNIKTTRIMEIEEKI